MKKKSLLKFIIAGLLCISSPSTTEAEVVIVESSGSYILGDEDNIKIAKERARQDALRLASEKAGVFVSSYSKVNNLCLTDDEIIVISSNLLKVTNESTVNETLGGQGFKLTCHIVASFDTDNIDTMQLLNNKTLALKAKDDELERLNQENLRLKEQASINSVALQKKNEQDFQITLYERELINKYENKYDNDDTDSDLIANKLSELDPDNDIYRSYMYRKLLYSHNDILIKKCNKYLQNHPDDFIADSYRFFASEAAAAGAPVDEAYYDKLVNKAKKLFPKKLYYETISPTVMINGIIVHNSIGILTPADLICRIFESHRLSSDWFKRRNPSTGEIEEVMIALPCHPDDIDGKECESIVNRYKKLYSSNA